MKIGILTFSRSINYGSFLQCHSLYSRLKKIDGIDVEILNYNTLNAELGFIMLSLLRGPVKGLKQYMLFRSAASEYFNLTNKYISNRYKKALHFINKLNYDIVIIGSDEVWKLDKFRDYPNVYWGGTGLNGKIMSYAASANRTHIGYLSSEVKEEMKKGFNNYAYIGVRDEHTYKFLDGLHLEKSIEMNCDPTFLFEFKRSSSLKNKLKNRYNLSMTKPMIGIVSDNHRIGRLLKEQYSRDYQIVALTCNNKYADVWLYDLTPFEWAEVFSYFSIVITSYFHATIFSILNRRPFVSFDYELFSLKHKTKLVDLLEKSGMMDSYMNIVKDNYCDEKLMEKVDLKIKKEGSYENAYDHFIEGEKEKYFAFEKYLLTLIRNERC